MSYSDFQTFSDHAVALDVQKKIELITILVKSLSKTEPETDKENEVAKINAVLEKKF